MKKSILFVCVILLLFASGCAEQGVTSSASEASQSISVPGPVMPESEPEEISQELENMCENSIYEMRWDGTLLNTWEKTPAAPEEPEEPPGSVDISIEDIAKEDDIVTVTVKLYGNVYIDPVTLTETIAWGPVRIISDDKSYPSQLAFGKSVMRFKESAEGLIPFSCSYEKYPHPGLDYLKSQTEKLQPVLSASEKIDVSKYNKLLVNYIWQVLFSRRYIEKPEDITLYDLENLRDGIELPFGSIYDDDYEDMYSPDYRMDVSLLTLMPNLESVYCSYRLKDYGVFENMRGLKKLTLYYADDELFRTLKVGHTDALMLYDPDVNMLDMTNINTEVLSLNSWSTAVRGFTGCDKIKKLYVMSTRTDMRLINAETFPNVSYLNLYFYSDTPRVRDFSQLASFGDNVKIDLYLDYQACNNQTIESLQGVKLNDLYLNPENGSYPIQDLDHSLIEKLDVQNLTLGMEMYFQERTGN